MHMKIGVCAMPDQLPLLQELGYDYIDVHFGWLAGLDDATFAAKTAEIERYGLAAEATQGFFGDIALFPEDDTEAAADERLRAIAAYAERGFARAAAWGGRVAVIGSGRQRNIPPSYDRAYAEELFARILAVCGEIADRHGMRVAVEPLARRETNFIHTVAEGAAMACRSGHPAVGTLVDLFHLWSNDDDLASLPTLGDTLIHAHIARPAADRNAPRQEDAPALATWATVLAQCPSVERISLECCWSPDFESAVRMAAPLMEPFRGGYTSPPTHS